MREGVTAVLAGLLTAAGCFQPKQAIEQPSVVPLEVGDKPIFAVAWSPDGLLLGVGTDQGDVMTFDVGNGALLNTLPRMLGRVTDLAFDPSGKRLLGVSLDGRWCEWSIVAPTEAPRCGSSKPPLLSVRLAGREEPAAAPPGAWAAREVPAGLLAVDSIGVTLQGRRVWVPPSGDTVTAGAISPSFVAVGTRAGRLFLLDHSGKVIAAARNGTHRINTVAISPKSDLVADGGVDGVLRFSTVPELRLFSKLPFETGWITDCAFSPDASRIAVAGHDLTHRPGVNRVRIWRVPSR